MVIPELVQQLHMLRALGWQLQESLGFPILFKKSKHHILHNLNKRKCNRRAKVVKEPLHVPFSFWHREYTFIHIWIYIRTSIFPLLSHWLELVTCLILCKEGWERKESTCFSNIDEMIIIILSICYLTNCSITISASGIKKRKEYIWYVEIFKESQKQTDSLEGER